MRIAAITNLQRIAVWDWFGNLLHTRQFGANEWPPQSFQFTPNGEILTWINTSLNAIVFWDVSTQELDTPLVPNSNIHVPGNIQGDLPTCHAFSRDGKTMAVGSSHGYVLLYKWTGANAPAAPAQEAEPAQPTALLENYPNPFNPETWIPYQLSEAAEVTVTIHSSDGKLVRTLELGQMPAGAYSDKDRAAYWDGQNEQGEPVASGVYFYTLTAGDFSATRKMVIRK